MKFAEALAELESRQPERMIPDLDRITTLARVLGDPQLTYPTIHVTGTNGKTTTSRLVSDLACAHGLTTGLYTSPHLESVTERIAICGEPIPETDFTAEYEHLLPFLREVDVMGERVTYFEVLTALAFLSFADAPVGLGVFEVGMGGKWDATNVVAGDVAVICPIALDHPELGATLQEKAIEKAAIIKEGKIAVSREQPEVVREIIEARAAEVGARLLVEDVDFQWEDRQPAVGGQVLTVRTPHGRYDELLLTVYGEHAARNAAAAIVAVEGLLDRPLDDDAVRETFASAASPGRLEILARQPLVILDGAHNPAGAAALAEALEEAFTWERLLLVLAVSADKDLEGIVAPFETLATEAFVTRYAGARAYAPQVLAAACRDAGLPAVAFDSVEEALAAAAANASEADAILVTGSLYTVADARRILTKP